MQRMGLVGGGLAIVLTFIVLPVLAASDGDAAGGGGQAGGAGAERAGALLAAHLVGDIDKHRAVGCADLHLPSKRDLQKLQNPTRH